ncbi:FmdB family zinc ribbon protein [Stenotrophobium rhamnosiphilum]|uniref:Zinc ribbon domain-containing protein n=1 Tax=Stenotrophobium rhamnosiphilum TaxID=2029166 RepID=A0A2T5MHI3_9GAMM|nr:zinc ribbon domain-containing protein [Stenotrophobium rhamnosiphilum]PTU32009.1 zinc ribbon domain-containing protein [Stenotrophobium rhamnosiphilum]
MPIYEYVCRACGETSEILQKLSEPDEKKCPLCGKLKLTRQVSAAGFRLKGAGWYETDFKSDNKKNLAGDTEASKPVTAAEKAAPAPAPAAKAETKEKPAKKSKAASK